MSINLRVLLFGGGMQSLSISRGLKDSGITVFNLADNKAVGKYSNYIDYFVPIDLQSFELSLMADFINKNSIGVVIPMEDEYAKWLSENKIRLSQLAPLCNIAIVDYSIFQKTINKASVLSICKDNGLPHPRTEAVTLQNVNEIAQSINYPVLIKPDILNGSRGIVKVSGAEELKSVAPEIIRSFGSCSIQEYIENNHYYNVMIYRYSSGEYSQVVVTDITRYYPIKGGSSSFCTTIEPDPNLVEPCKCLLEKLDWTGFADFDVLQSKSGDYKIIEINPRVPASVHAAYISGIDFGRIIVDDMVNKSKSSMEYVPGKQLRFLGLDIAWFIYSPNRFNTHPSWFKFFSKDLYYQEGGIRDFRAMVYSIWSGIIKQLSPSFRKAKSGMN